MNQIQPVATDVLHYLGISVRYSECVSGGWGWSMQNAKLTRPWVGDYATCAEATTAALDWVIEQAWRGVLFPILQAESGLDQLSITYGLSNWDVDPAKAEELLAPWLQLFEPKTMTSPT